MQNTSLSNEDSVELRRQLDAHFNLEELKTLCFDIGVDYEELAGDSKSGFTRSLIAYLRRRGQLNNLIQIIQEVRPDVDWTRYRQRESLRPSASHPTQSRYLQIFLCHASTDKPAVRQLYKKLLANGFMPWLDEENILGGQVWEYEITKALRASDVVIICSSEESVSKAGYIQKEIRFALDRALEQPEGAIYLIPLKLRPCELPESLNKYQWVKYFEDDGYERLTRALRSRAASLGIRPTTEYKYVI